MKKIQKDVCLLAWMDSKVVHSCITTEEEANTYSTLLVVRVDEPYLFRCLECAGISVSISFAWLLGWLDAAKICESSMSAKISSEGLVPIKEMGTLDSWAESPPEQ